MSPLEQARALIERSERIAVLTGAGISAESGIPTFRGAGGLWRNYRPEDLATPEAFARNPSLVWEWYRWRRGLIAQAEPNSGHRALVALERRTPVFTLVTQNVDGLHGRAGSKNVQKIHGDIWLSRCTECSYQRTDKATEEEGVPPLPGLRRDAAAGRGLVWRIAPPFGLGGGGARGARQRVVASGRHIGPGVPRRGPDRLSARGDH